MGVKRKKLGIAFYKIGAAVAYLRLKFLEGLYSVHVKVRYLHDKTYAKGGGYKKWTDKSYSATVHKAVLIGFIISFLIFSGLQDLFPYFFSPTKTREVQAGSNTKVWTTRGDFNNGTTKASLSISGTTDTDNADIRLAPATKAIAVSAGAYHSLALMSDGTVWAWGSNIFGQLGDDTTTQRLTPIQVKSPDGSGYLTDIVKIAAGHASSYAVKSDGTVWAWGANTSGGGYLGDNTTTQRKLPVQVVGVGGTGYLSGIIDISASKTSSGGGNFVVVLKSDNTVYSWGDNTNGKLGDDTTTTRLAPVQVIDSSGTGYLTGVTQISVGGEFCAFIKIRWDCMGMG